MGKDIAKRIVLMINGKFFIAVILFFCVIIGNAYSHGTEYEIIRSELVVIRASLDTGEAMAESDVLIFAPGETDVSDKTITDKDGVFSFLPDKPGTWIIQVRGKEGHGLRINLDIDESLKLAADQNLSSAIPLLQKIVMVICVLWGFIGTFLYFKRRKPG